jgi:hypothetical protein
MSETPVAKVPEDGRQGHVNPLEAPVDSPWRRVASRVPILDGRLVGTAAGLLGIALAVPLTFLPTHSIGMDPEQTDPDSVPFRLSFWSWGRVAETTPGVETPLSFNNMVMLFFLIGSLLVGAAACLLYAFRRGMDGRILGAVGIGWVAAQVVSDVMRREGEMRMGLWTQGGEATVEVLPGGMLQVASAVSLCVALAAVAWHALLGLARPVWTWSTEVMKRASERARRDEEEHAGPSSRVGIATIRDTRPSSDQPAWHASEGVGFSDDPSSDPDGVRPPP